MRTMSGMVRWVHAALKLASMRLPAGPTIKSSLLQASSDVIAALHHGDELAIEQRHDASHPAGERLAAVLAWLGDGRDRLRVDQHMAAVELLQGEVFHHL